MQLTLFVLLFSCVAAAITDAESEQAELYAPVDASCPSANNNFLRKADTTSDDEKSWISARNVITQASLRDFLKYTAKLDDNEITRALSGSKYANTTVLSSGNLSTANIGSPGPVKIGLAFSGGGYRAMLAGGGQLAGLDNRTDGAFEHGLGGILQSTTYLAGLSGGNWMVTSLVLNKWASVTELVHHMNLWDLSHAVYNLGGLNLIKSYDMWSVILHEVKAKLKAGFLVSVTDFWARSLSRQFFKREDSYGVSYKWSGIRDLDAFKNHEMPFPMSISLGRTLGVSTGMYLDPSKTTVFETNPYEMGSWDKYLYSFTDVKYIGTAVNSGKPTQGKCVEGLDNASFIMGTSSSLFNTVVYEASQKSSVVKAAFKELFSGTVKSSGTDSFSEEIVADYKPSPFYGNPYGTSDQLRTSDTLHLVDGGEDFQNIPLVPLLQKQRQLDVVFAFDNSADTSAGWPNGTSLVTTYERQFTDAGQGIAMPYVPGLSTWLHNQLNKRPVFFGCDAKNLTGLAHVPPLIVSVPNTEHSYDSSVSTFKMKYNKKERNKVIANGFETSTRGNLTVDTEWATCVGCAVIRRSQERLGLEQSAKCQECFYKYCWDGSLYEGTINDDDF